ncbi:hypothetical protein ABIB40_001151 [Pedobacter sp. UYP30]|uniref:hypothetical protein n=1 Tax=Pedobacter sp. UYP30 TaxID=1756400 RepID=UPI00339A0F1C
MFKKLFQHASILLALVSIVSCKTVQQANLKETKQFIGIWKDNANPGNTIVFNSDGSFYNISKENDVQIITHSGTFKVLADNMYVVSITDARADAMYDMKGRQYANYYTLSNNQKNLKLSGVVDGRNGSQPLRWTNDLTKVNTIN